MVVSFAAAREATPTSQRQRFDWDKWSLVTPPSFPVTHRVFAGLTVAINGCGYKSKGGGARADPSYPVSRCKALNIFDGSDFLRRLPARQCLVGGAL